MVTVKATDAGLVPDDPTAAAVNSATLNQLIQDLGSGGGGRIDYENGVYDFAGPIQHDRHNVTHVGCGAGAFRDGAAPYLWTGGTMFRAAAPMGAFFTFRPQQDTANGRRLGGGGMQDIALDCQQAEFGIQMWSANRTRMHGISVMSPKHYGIYCSVVGAGWLPESEPRTCMWLDFHDIYVDAWDSLTTIARGIQLDGDALYNSCFNHFGGNTRVLTIDGCGLVFGNCDGNVVEMVTGGARPGIGTGCGLLFRSGPSPQFARHNTVTWCQTSCAVESTSPARPYAPAANRIVTYDMGNGAPLPVLLTAPPRVLASGPMLQYTAI